MRTVQIIHFYRPNGRQELEETDVPDEVGVKFDELTACGCRITAEVLTTGEVSFCIEEPELGDFDGVLVENGPKLIQSFRDLILGFDKDRFISWKAEMKENK